MIRILYDGECPFCVSYVRYARLRSRVGEVELINAREADDWVEQYAAQGIDIDESFIVDTGEAILGHGSALAFIHANLAPRWTGLPFLANPRFLNTIYPGLRAARNGALRVLGVPLIRARNKALDARPDTEEAKIEPVEEPAAGKKTS
ncbi:MAG: DCC1-like thiol-disulfide oxidoreductase family protein [Pseudomonadota bacterium]